MGFIWTEQLEDGVNGGNDIVVGPIDVRILLMARAPLLTQDKAQVEAFKAISTVNDLLSRPGWEEVSVPGYQRQVNRQCTLYTSGMNTFLIFGQSSSTWVLNKDTQVEALVLAVPGNYVGVTPQVGKQTATAVGTAYGPVIRTTNPPIDPASYLRWWPLLYTAPMPRINQGTEEVLVTATTYDAVCRCEDEYVIFATDTPFRQKTKTVFRNGDGISGLLDILTNNRWLFGWSASNGILNSVAEGTTALYTGPPKFESSRLQHVWLFPQRVNYAANPSFEYSDGFWQSNKGSLTRVSESGGYPSAHSGYVGAQIPLSPLPQFAPTDRLYVRSSKFFPNERTITFQLMAKGHGTVRVGLETYSRDYMEHSADWGEGTDLVFQEWELSSEHYVQMKGIRTLPDTGYEASLLIEVRGSVTPQSLQITSPAAPSITYAPTIQVWEPTPPTPLTTATTTAAAYTASVVVDSVIAIYAVTAPTATGTGICYGADLVISESVVSPIGASGQTPAPMVYSPDINRLYVGNRDTNSISVIDVPTNTYLGDITLGFSDPIGLAYRPPTVGIYGKVYVTNYTANTVAVIDTSTDTVTAFISVGAGPRGIGYCPVNDRLYVANYTSGTVSVIDPETNNVVQTVSVGTAPFGVACTRVNGLTHVAYVTRSTTNVVVAISQLGNTANITVGFNPRGIAPDGFVGMYVANITGTISVIDTTTNTVTSTIGSTTNTGELAVGPVTVFDSGSLANFICVTTSGGVRLLNTSGGGVRDVSTSGAPQGVCWVSPYRRFYTTIYNAPSLGSVQVVSPFFNVGSNTGDGVAFDANCSYDFTYAASNALAAFSVSSGVAFDANCSYSVDASSKPGFAVGEGDAFNASCGNFTGFDIPNVAIDQCTVEEGALLDWQYFDGDTTYAAPGDYSWYGEDSGKVGRSYSLWYNNQRDINGRLFARRIDDTTLYTSMDEQLDSMLSEWVPAGVTIVPHWGALTAGDTMLPPMDNSTSVLPVTLWPEKAQTFGLFSIGEVTQTGVTLQVIGEGGYPISGAYVVSGSTTYEATIAPRPWEQPGLRPDQVDVLKAQLYDLSIAQTVTITWPPIPSFTTNTLYLARGDGDSPQSFLAYELQVASLSGFGTTAGEAFDAVTNSATTPVGTTATGTALAANVEVRTAAGDAASIATAQLTGASASPVVEQGVASGQASVGEIQFGLLVDAVLASASAVASTNSANVDETPETATAAGQANDTQEDRIDITGPTVGIGVSEALTAPATVTTTYRDDFVTANGTSLGLFSGGGLTWQNVSSGGGWTVQGGNAYNTGTADIGNITWVNTPSPNAVITAGGVSNEGGQGIAFRIQDSNNYWIFHTNVVYGVTGSTYNQCIPTYATPNPGGVYPYGPWTADTNGCGTLQASPTWYYAYYTSGPCSGQVQCARQYEYVSGSCGSGYRSRSYCLNYYAGWQNSYGPLYSYVLSKVQGGSYTTVWSSGTVTAATVQDLKVELSGDSIKCYTGSTLRTSITDSFLNTQTRHGIGRGPGSNTYQQSNHWTSFEILV